MKCAEMEGLQDRLATLQAEKKTILLEKNDLNAHIKHLESELQLARQANRCILIHRPVSEMHFFQMYLVLQYYLILLMKGSVLLMVRYSLCIVMFRSGYGFRSTV